LIPAQEFAILIFRMKHAFLALLGLLLAHAALAQDWGEWEAMTTKTGHIAGYSRSAQTMVNGEHRHWIEFTVNTDLSHQYYVAVTDVKCNDSATVGYVNLGYGNGYARHYSFNYDDDEDVGNWDWDIQILEKP
jgi:hypothetical protein